MSKLNNLKDILNAEVKSEEDKNWTIEMVKYADAFELDDKYLENMSRKEIAQLIDNLINDSSLIKQHNDETIVILEYKDADVLIILDDNCEYPGDVEQYPRYIDNIQYVLKEKPLSIAILNTTILTADGDFSLKTISLEEAQNLIEGKEILSAVGHDSTAQILTELLERDVPVNRIEFTQKPGQKALCFKLKGRPPEGAILTTKEINKIGYEFKLLEMK